MTIEEFSKSLTEEQRLFLLKWLNNLGNFFEFDEEELPPELVNDGKD